MKPPSNEEKKAISIILDPEAGSGTKGLHVSGPLEKKNLSWYLVRPGLGILTAVPLGMGRIAFELKASSPCLILTFSFFRESKRSHRTESVAGTAADASGAQKICATFGTSARHDLHAGISPLFMAMLTVTREALVDLCRNSLSALPPALHAAMNDGSEAFFAQRPLDAAVRLELHQMLFSCTPAFGKRLHHERAARRLAAHELERLAHSQSGSTPGKDPLPPDDRIRLEKARSILVSRMDSPPDIKTLARRVGMNENKLKTGFKQMFDTSPKAFLRRQRMEAAREMLLAGGKSVTRIALEVGYSNPSAFAACFSRFFGCAPSLLKR
jgi:AraC-like DNA-binding protein